jgi:hypothetical protein
MRGARLVVLGLALALVALAAGCGSSRVVNQWSNPEYAAPHFNRIMVIGITKQPSIRRAFEDEFVARLKEKGVDAVQSYLFLPEDGPVEEARLNEAVRQANVDATITTRLVKVEQKTEVRPGMYAPGPPYGFYRGYYGAWSGYYEPPTVYQYDVYISETSLYDVQRSQLVWSGTVQTQQPGDIRKEIAHYVDVVIDALKDRHILAAR